MDPSSPSFGCTAGCASTAETANAGTVEALAAALLGLSAADRARLAAMLMMGQGEGKAAGGPQADLP